MDTNKPRTFNRRQARENAAFLAALARTGNVRLAARELGVHRSTFTKRRQRSAAFAAEWDGALAAAHARLNRPQTVRSGPRSARRGADQPHPVRLANGRLQLRAATTRRIDPEARQAFLAALSATANVRLSARAAGFAHSSFYRLRDYDPGFAREMRLALQLGYDRIELALIESFEPDSYRDGAWRSNEPPPIPPMREGGRSGRRSENCETSPRVPLIARGRFWWRRRFRRFLKKPPSWRSVCASARLHDSL